MARPLSQTTTKQTLVARIRAGPQADHRAFTQFLGPTPASSTLHPASGGTMEILDPVHTKPAAHTTGHVVVRYGSVSTAREPVLNRQCRHLQASATPHRCTEAPIGNHVRYTWPTSVTQKSFPTILVNSCKRGFLYSRQNPTRYFLEWTFPEHSILMMKALLEK